MLNYLKLFYKSLLVETLFMTILYFILFASTTGLTKEFYIALPFALIFFVSANIASGYKRYSKQQNEGE